MTFAIIIPTRDRRKLFRFAVEQLDKQTLQPTNRYYIAFDAETTEPDLTRRVRQGVEMAKKDGMEYVFIWEDDDFYNNQYLKFFINNFGDADFMGYDNTFYYHIGNRTWNHQKHPGRSSLFCTAFKVSALDDFIWPGDHHLFLDIKLWEHARDKKKIVKLISLPNNNIGIKGHGEGKPGGKGHKMTFENKDNEQMSWLASHTEKYQFDFYKNWK